MQQADSAHSATRSHESPSNTENYSATRRGMLTAFVALPALAAAVPATAMGMRPAVAAPNDHSPVMAAIKAELAACYRYDSLPADLESTDPIAHAAEEQRLNAAWDHLIAAEPESWDDLIAQVSHLTNEAEFGLKDEQTAMILRRMRRLAACA